MARRLACLLLASTLGCMPAPIRAVDDWLTAYAAGDDDRLAELTASADRPALLEALAAAPTSSRAMSLPPRPLSHEIVETADKAEGRQTIATKLTLRNPLPAASKRIGQNLPGIPETRSLRRRFLVVRNGEAWRVKLDLERVTARADLAAQLLGMIATGRLDQAEARLARDFPPPPDDGDYQAESDRLIDELRRRIDEARARTSTTAARARTSPASQP